MLPFNTEFQTGQSRITQTRLSVLLASGTLLSLTEEDIMLGGISRDTSTTVDGEFTIGGAVTGKLRVGIENSDQRYSAYDFRGAVITASLGGQLSDNTNQLVQIGIYTVDEYSYDGTVITLVAYDNFYKFDKPCQNTVISFPKTVSQLVSQACSVAGVTLANTSVPNGSYSVAEQPQQWDTMTWHDVIAYCAQIGCCFARILPDGKLFLSWYDTSMFNETQLDGGTFDTTTTPYSDGAVADGGDFTYTDTETFNGGAFGDRDNAHYFGSLFDLTVDTDDVLITGVNVVLVPSDNIDATEDTEEYEAAAGTDGYRIRISDNPLIETTTQADSIATYIYNIIGGARFRPLSASITENPSVEAGDVALVIDRYGNTYTCFISHAVYTTNSATSIQCDASSSMQNLKARYSEVEKTKALAERVFKEAISSADDAMSMIVNGFATVMGLYRFEKSDGHGGTYYIYGNKPGTSPYYDERNSDIQWKFTAGAFMVSSDYGAHWNAALSAAGTAVFQDIYAVKVVADNIKGGTISGVEFESVNEDQTLNIGSVHIDAGQISTTTRDQNFSTNISNAQIVLRSNSGYSGSFIGNTLISHYYMQFMRYFSANQSSGIYTQIGLLDDDFNGTKYGCIDFSYGNLGENPAHWMRVGKFLVLEGDYTGYYNVLESGVYGYQVFTNKLFVIPGGSKSKIANTQFGARELYCYEMPTPMYGDIGCATIGDDGMAVVDLDPIFSDCISEKGEYYVFIQNEGAGESYISEKNRAYFIISGTPGLKVAWELKGRQYDLPNIRAEQHTGDNEESDIDYAEQAFNSVMEYLDGGIL